MPVTKLDTRGVASSGSFAFRSVLTRKKGTWQIN